MKKTKQIAIVGLGLIGGSIGLALKSKLPEFCVTGFDKNKKSSKIARKIKAVDKITNCLESCVGKADIVILAVPVKTIISILKTIDPWLKPRCIVTDTGSTKQQICQTAQKFLGKDKVFIGGHPMAGKEKSGIQAAEESLFRNRKWCLAPSTYKGSAKIEILKNIIQKIGGDPIILKPGLHDFLATGASHLPLVVAVCLTNSLTSNKRWEEIKDIASTGFRDTTRIASGNVEMATDIFATNSKNILFFIDGFITELTDFKKKLIKNDSIKIKTSLLNAKEKRGKWIRESGL